MSFKFYAHKNERGLVNNFCHASLILLIALLVGCGGGTPSKTILKTEPSPVVVSSSSKNPEAPPQQESPIPTSISTSSTSAISPTLDALLKVSAGPRQLADPKVVVNLQGSATAANGADITSILWTQISGPDVSITSNNEFKVPLQMPAVFEETQFEFRLTVSDSQGRTNSATTSITVKPAPTFLKVEGGKVVESDTVAIFKISLNARATTPISVSYTTQDHSSSSDNDFKPAGKELDYTTLSGEVTFSPGETVKEISVSLIDDDIHEENEVLNLKITAVNGAPANTNIGTVIIRDDDKLLLQQSIQFEKPDPTTIYADQGYDNAVNSLQGGSGRIIYSSSDESIATVSGLGVVTVLSVGSITITATKLGDENYFPTSTSYRLNIISPKPLPVVSIAGDAVTENSASATFTFSLDIPATKTISVFYSTEDSSSLEDADSGFARSNLDFQPTSGEVIFAPGEIVKEIPVLLINDDLDEADEVFYLKITAVNGVTANTNTAVTVIQDDDVPLLTQSIEFEEQGPITIYANQTRTNAIKSSGAGTGGITYSSSDLSIASVNEQGVVSGIAVGVTTITATKNADESYLSASTSYQLHIVSRGAAPSVSIVDSVSFKNADGYSVQVGEAVNLTGQAYDLEDGTLPTDIQKNQMSESGPTSFGWRSDIGGILGYGESLSIKTLSQGTHNITYSVIDSDENAVETTIRIFVGNIAPLAMVTETSTFCPTADPETEVDLDPCIDSDSPTLEPFHRIELTWEIPITTSSIELYMYPTRITRDYAIKYFDGTVWIDIASIVDNAEAHRTHVKTVTTKKIRIEATQENDFSIDEIIVFGMLGTPLNNWVGTYGTETGWGWYDNFSPFTISKDGVITLGSTQLKEVTYDPLTSRLTWPWQNVTTHQGFREAVRAEIQFSISEKSELTFSGIIYPDESSGPLTYKGTQITLANWAGTYDSNAAWLSGDTSSFDSLTIGLDGSLTMGITRLKDPIYDPVTASVKWPSQTFVDQNGNVVIASGEISFSADSTAQIINGVIQLDETQGAQFVENIIECT